MSAGKFWAAVAVLISMTVASVGFMVLLVLDVAKG